jgi:quinol---cytochrome c reductase iron-sulfur subunit, bacillus type
VPSGSGDDKSSVAETDQQQANHDSRSEQLAAPGPSIWPIAFALGIALVLVGVVLNWVVFGIGIGIALAAGLAWVYRSTRRLRQAPAPVAAAEEAPAVAAAEKPESFPRNVFLERTTLGLGAVIGAAVTIPVVGFAVAPTFIGQQDKDVNLGPMSNFPEGKWVVAQFTSIPSEGAVSRRTAFIRNNGMTADGQPSFTILSNRCAHLGCPTQPGGKTETDNAIEVAVSQTKEFGVTLIPTNPSNFSCPCHGGSYDLEGNRVAGPPVRALDRYLYAIVDGNIVLQKRVSVGEVEGTGAEAMIRSYTRFDPGEHVDGPEAILYPASPQGI